MATNNDHGQRFFAKLPRVYHQLDQLEPDSDDQVEQDSPPLEQLYPEHQLDKETSASPADEQSDNGERHYDQGYCGGCLDEGGDDHMAEEPIGKSDELENANNISQELHAATSDFVKEIVLGPNLHEEEYFRAIAPVYDIEQGFEQWRDVSQTVRYGLFNDIPLVVLPVEDIRSAYQSLEDGVPKQAYNHIVASDITQFWTQPRDYQLSLVTQQVQRLEVIGVLVDGWKRLGVLPNEPDIHAGNVQTWVHLLTVRGDLLRHHSELQLEESKNWLTKRFIVAAQTCGLLPKCAWIRSDNAQAWMHLLVPIHDPFVTAPPGTRDQAYWTWHQNVAQRYWRRCGITDEASLRFNRLWHVYRPGCTPYLYIDAANIVTPDNKPDSVPAHYYEMSVTERRETRLSQLAEQAANFAQQPSGHVVGEDGRLTAGNLSGHPLDDFLDDSSDEGEDANMEDIDSDEDEDESMEDIESDDNDDGGDSDNDEDPDDGPQGAVQQPQQAPSSAESIREAAQAPRENSQMPPEQSGSSSGTQQQDNQSVPSSNNASVPGSNNTLAWQQYLSGSRDFTNITAQQTDRPNPNTIPQGIHNIANTPAGQQNLLSPTTIAEGPHNSATAANTSCENRPSPGVPTESLLPYTTSTSQLVFTDPLSLSQPFTALQPYTDDENSTESDEDTGDATTMPLQGNSSSPGRGGSGYGGRGGHGGSGGRGGRAGGRHNTPKRLNTRFHDHARLREIAIANAFRASPSQPPSTGHHGQDVLAPGTAMDLTRGFQPIGSAHHRPRQPQNRDMRYHGQP
ncbi:uncharacterized protein PG986_002783 [Apiospora aurea]|uniref:Uncharacterized protein n=1 Tax=Apiospora aurea TaxID=335848 RepID=A0ABR1QPT9_9PEZI